MGEVLFLFTTVSQFPGHTRLQTILFFFFLSAPKAPEGTFVAHFTAAHSRSGQRPAEFFRPASYPDTVHAVWGCRPTSSGTCLQKATRTASPPPNKVRPGVHIVPVSTLSPKANLGPDLSQEAITRALSTKP